ncbi:MAG TPA: hypothetical protein VMT17_04090 [Anaeromyxobacteraceae bacterium]|nr:hypothetical protein [Anaeromyxobacteraceae bacterium]
MADNESGSANRFEGLFRPWFLPALGLTAAVAVGVFYAAGVVSESAVGAVVAVLVPVVLGLMVARPAVEHPPSRTAAALLVAAGVLSALVAAVPALEAVHPGDPDFVAEFEREDQAASLPEGMGGRVLLLVSAPLGGAGEPQVNFRLSGFSDPVEGRLERTFGYARVGRSGRARVAHDHDADWFEARIPAGAKEIRLERLQGRVAGGLRVSVYRDWLPRAAAWVLSLLVLVLAALGEVRAGRDAGSTIAAGVALGFGLVVSYNVTPAQAVVPSLWAIVLGAIAGAPAAVLVRMLVRRLVPSASPVRKGKAPKDKGEQDE